MLERAAGCLESGSLGRLLPRSKKSLKSCRKLHSAFWNHGAGDLELSPLLATLLRGQALVENNESHQRRQETLSGHGGMMLGFLYPAGTMTFLRQHLGYSPDRQESRRMKVGHGKLGHRLYTWAAATDTLKTNGPSGPATIVGGEDIVSNDPITDGNLAAANVESLRSLIALANTSDYEKAWQQYLLIESPDQRRLQSQLLEYLSKSSRLVDAERSMELFEELDVDSIGVEAYAAAIRSCLRLGQLLKATQLHQAVLQKFYTPAGSDELMAYLVDNLLWPRAFDTWIDLERYKQRSPNQRSPVYRVLESLPDLSKRVSELVEYVDRKIKGPSSPASLVGLVEFASEIVVTAMLRSESFDRRTFIALLETLQRWGTDTPSVYQSSVDLLLSLDQSELVMECYQTARQQMRVKFKPRTLLGLLRIFSKNHGVSGMLLVLDDYSHFHGGPTARAYQICMNAFVSQGDTATVHALFEQFTRRLKFVGSPISADNFVPILNVHAQRGELADVIRAFNDIQDIYNLQPSLLCWNILINAYGKVHDVDGAFGCFEKLLESPDLRPDHYTFGTIMGICATHGDLDRIVEIYRHADELKIEKSVAMVDCLVLGHIQDDDLQQAENICKQSLGMNLTGSRTRMWNYLLVAYGLRRDLRQVNRLLRQMSDSNLDYDTYTYSALMLALSMVKQPDRGYAILRDVMTEAGVKPNSLHYAVVMGGYLATGETHKMFTVQNEMLRQRIRDPWSTDLLSLKATLAKNQKLLDTSSEENLLEQATLAFLNMVNSADPRAISRPAMKGSGRMSQDIAYSSTLYSYMLFVLGQQNQFQAVNQLYDMFKNSLPKHRQDKPPIQVLSALMAAKLREGDHNAVQECWDRAVSQAYEQGRPLPDFRPTSSGIDTNPEKNVTKRNHNKEILPSHELDLTQPLTTYMTSLARQYKINLLSLAVNKLINDGFTLDNNNWNYYIQILTRNTRWKLAFNLCETHLMDGWTGWASIRWTLPQRNRLPIELRNERKKPRHLRPKYHTLLYLARAFLDLEAAGAESRRKQQLFEDLQRHCPKTMNAIKTLERVDDGIQREVLGRY